MKQVMQEAKTVWAQPWAPWALIPIILLIAISIMVYTRVPDLVVGGIH